MVIGTKVSIVFALLCTGPQGRETGEPVTPAAAVSQTTQADAAAPASHGLDTDGPSAEEMGRWLVHLARHQGHLVGRSDPRSASLHVIALLEAAKQLCPDCPDVYFWLFDLMYRMDRAGAAREALSKYVELSPQDDAARIRHLQLALEDLQTAEDRFAYIQAQLKQKPLPRAYSSELHRHLARYHYERRETEPAAREIEQALHRNPMNVPARQLAYEMFGETEPALQRVEMALQLISINPSQANLVWDLGEFLDRLSLHRYAQEWYNRAIELHHRSEGKPVPAAFWHKLAVSYMRSGDFSEAKEAADSALKVDASSHITRLLRARALEKLGEVRAAAEDMDFVSKAYEARIEEVVQRGRVDEAAEIAWFYCYHKPDPDRALKLASVAREDGNPGSLARLAWGYALRMNGRTDEAVKALEPLAGSDQLAALELARIQMQRGNKSQAITLLHKAATIQYSGIAFEMIRDMLAKYGETAAQQPLHTKVIATLDKFHRDVFSYHEQPGDFLRFTMRLPAERLRPVGSIELVFRLENVGPFPITFGDGYMARALIALSAKVGVPDGGNYDNFLQVMLNARPVLVPGDAVEKRVSIDVGSVRELLIRNVTKDLEIELTAMFDPVFQDGKLTAGLGTINAEPILITRPGLDIRPTAIAALMDRADSPVVSERIEVAESVAALLAEAQHTTEASKANQLPLDALSTTLAVLLSDSDWRVRARSLVALGWTKLDGRTTNAAAHSVRDQDNAVVRMLAIRLFAEQHGPRFEKALAQLSRTDPSRFVRIMSQSYLPTPVGAQANRGDDGAQPSLP